MNVKIDKQIKRTTRTRGKFKGTNRPRVSVSRSNKYITAQIIDDIKGVTLLGVSEKNLDKKEGTKTEKAKSLGILLANKAKAKKITKVVFDRGGNAYHGRVKSIAEGLREGGLEF